MPKLTGQLLTAAFCRSARPRISGGRAVQTDYADAEVRGLALRVSAAGQKSWSFRFRDRRTGIGSRITLGRFDPSTEGEPNEDGLLALTLHGARVAARKLRTQVDADRNPAQELRRKRDAARHQPIKTLVDLAEVYFKACESGAHRGGKGRKKAPSTLNAERWLWGKHIAPRLGSEPLDDITRGRIREHLTAVFEASGGQANKVRALLSQLFNYAISQERLEVNPVTHVARMSEANSRTRTLTDKELKAFWGVLQNSEHLVIRDKKAGEKVLISRLVRIAIELLLFTVQRRAEVSGIRLAELDLARKTWLIPPERTKGRVEHLVPLSDHVVALIEEALELQETRRKGASDFLFPSPYAHNAPIEAAALSHAMADLTAALGLDDVRLHDLRRTGATGIAAMNIPPFVVSKVLAHKDGGGGAAITARHYNLYAYAAEKRDALDRWSRYIEDLVGLVPKTAPRSAPMPSQPEPHVRFADLAAERLWTDLVEDDVLLRCRAAATERLWTDLVDAA